MSNFMMWQRSLLALGEYSRVSALMQHFVVVVEESALKYVLCLSIFADIFSMSARTRKVRNWLQVVESFAI